MIDLVLGEESRNGKAESGEATATSSNPSRLSAVRSPLSPGGEVGHSNHEPGESEETIGMTSNHPFWSVDRQEFVQAGSLEIGERLQTLSGDVKVVQQKLPRPGPQPVFNLEVHNEHVYFVGQDGVLVHNSAEYNGSVLETYVIGDGVPPNRSTVGAMRERVVADELGGVLAQTSGVSKKGNLAAKDWEVPTGIGKQTTPIDVLGANYEMAIVGGPNKAANPQKSLKRVLELKHAARHAGVRPIAVFFDADLNVDSTYTRLIEASQMALGEQNVFIRSTPTFR